MHTYVRPLSASHQRGGKNAFTYRTVDETASGGDDRQPVQSGELDSGLSIPTAQGCDDASMLLDRGVTHRIEVQELSAAEHERHTLEVLGEDRVGRLLDRHGVESVIGSDRRLGIACRQGCGELAVGGLHAAEA